MKKVKLYGLPHCTTCQKAVAYLKELGVEIENFHDVKENQLTRKEVEELVKLVGGAENLFSKRAMKYRSLGLHEMELSDEQLVDYMVEEYTFYSTTGFSLWRQGFGRIFEKEIRRII